MNKMSTEKRSAIIRALVEGNSIRATCRIVGCSKGAALKLLVEVGEACQEFHDRAVRVIDSPRLQFDEIWCFVGSKEKNTMPSKRNKGNGSAWTWCALDAETKLMVSWYVSDRSGYAASEFAHDVASRVVGEPSITTDGLHLYGKAIREAFGKNVNHGTVEKMYGSDPKNPESRYSPATCIGCRKAVESGNPKPESLTTSHIERANLTLRMGNRRYTRLTNAFSKKLANLRHSVALHFVHYNFCRIHQTLRITPAMKAGVATRVWSIDDIVALMDVKVSK